MEESTRIVEQFLSFADTIVDDFDVVDLLDRLVQTCMEIDGVSAGGLLLVNAEGQMELVASTGEEAALLEYFQMKRESGPCLDAIALGTSVIATDQEQITRRWPAVGQATAELGFQSVYAFPMQVKDQTLGALNLFGATSVPLSQADQRLAQSLAHLATIGLVQQRALQRMSRLTEQLQGALDSRVAVEQAKGLLAAQGNITTRQAFEALRRYSRRRRIALSGVAQALVDRQLPARAVLDESPPQQAS